jgi:hypothetical protein
MLRLDINADLILKKKDFIHKKWKAQLNLLIRNMSITDRGNES